MTDESDIDTLEQNAIANYDEGGEEEGVCVVCGGPVEHPEMSNYCLGCSDSPLSDDDAAEDE